jgi:hypothetical protein
MFGKAVLGGVLVATAGSELQDFLDANVQGFEFLANDALRHPPTQFLHQYPHITFLREREGVEIYTLLPIKGPQFTDRWSSSVGG